MRDHQSLPRDILVRRRLTRVPIADVLDAVGAKVSVVAVPRSRLTDWRADGSARRRASAEPASVQQVRS